MQLYVNEIAHKLSPIDRLHIRIAKERNVDINTLKGDEFKIIREYQKLEEKKELINNFHDFF